MSSSPSPIAHGYLVLADISGYTSFLSQTELDHAHEILTDLLEIVLTRFQALLTIHKIEGDAIFAYAPDSSVIRGETLLELIESTYMAFRERMRSVRRHTTCSCRACQSIPMLDLKFVLHHGDYVLQHIGRTPELAGSDVNLVHRLLKNHVSDSTGWRAYALFTGAAMDCMGLHLDGLVDGSESYEHLGEVTTFAMDLHPRYEALLQVRRVYLSAADADRVLEFDFASPPVTLWEWFNDPLRRSKWMSAEIVPILRIGGRLAPGAQNHCVHGTNGVVVENVLDFKPFDYYTVEHRPRGSPIILRMTFQFLPTDRGGTHLVFTARSQGAGLPRWACRIVTGLIVERNLLRKWAFGSIDDLARSESAAA